MYINAKSPALQRTDMRRLRKRGYLTQAHNAAAKIAKHSWSISGLLEILSSISVGMDALTSQVAIFGVLQNAHACATTGDELGFEYVHMFIARLAQQTSDQAKIAKLTEGLQKKASGSDVVRIRSGPVNEQIAAINSSPARWQNC